MPGRELKGTYFAMEFLPLQNQRNAGDEIPDEQFISAKGKRVIILGGGDTGADCLGTVHRQGAKSVMPVWSSCRGRRSTALADDPWPTYPNIYRVSSAHEEGGERDYSHLDEVASPARTACSRSCTAYRVEFVPENGRMAMKEVPGSEFEEDVDLLLLAMGFLGPERYMLEQLGVELNERGNVKADAEQDDERPRRLHRRRHDPRPVAHRLGDRGGPRRRPRHRPLPDGRDGATGELAAYAIMARRRSRPMRWATPAQIRRRIARDEGQRTEFKESFSLENKVIESLCAFANSRGGIVLVGVRNDKRIIGVSLGANTLENFANNARRHTAPALCPEIAEVEIDGRVVVAISVESVGEDVVYCFNTPLIRSGKTNQLMTPDLQKKRLFPRFKGENRPKKTPHRSGPMQSDSWEQREERRKEAYVENRGLFLVHTWQPSQEANQVADIIVRMQQHFPNLPLPDDVEADLPLADGKIKSVEYYLGPKFFRTTVTKADAADGFKLEVSAYGPVLCLAVVNFDDGHDPIELRRYLDFQ